MGVATLIFIAWQAKATAESASAAFEQIQVVKAKERARLVIDSAIPVPEVGAPEGIALGQRPLEIALFVRNEGATKAFNSRA